MRRRRAIFQRAIPLSKKFALLDPTSRQKLFQAHSLMESENYKEAAPIFDQLAENTLAKGMIRRAPFLFHKASRAYFLSGQINAGKEMLYKGLNLLLEGQRWQVLQSMIYRSVHELEQMKLVEIAQEVRDWQSVAFQKSTTTPSPTSDENPKMQSKLPPKCPYCGATVSPNEFEWIDPNTIECAYCGSIIRI